MRPLVPLSLRNRFLLLVLLAAVMPLGLVGLWLSRSAQMSGEQLVRQRLDASLLKVVNSVGSQWGGHRSLLLDLAESRGITAALREERALTEASNTETVLELEQAWSEAAEIASEAFVRDRAGMLIGRLPRAEAHLQSTSARPGLTALPHSIPIRDPRSGAQLGTLEVYLRTERLFPTGMLISGVGGATLALFDDRTGAALAPLPLEAGHFSRPRFIWMDEEWISVGRRLREPPLRLVLAGPVGSATRPFEQAARRGLLALVLVAVVAFGLATLFTRRSTGSLLLLADAADAVSQGDLSRRADEEGPPEIKGLARAFNSMTANLSLTLQKLTQREAVAAVGEFATTLAHEVRNPLTAVRMDLQLTRHKVEGLPDAQALIDHALTEIDRLNESVNGVLRVARSGRTSPECVDLLAPLRAAARAAGPRFETRNASLDTVLPQTPIWVYADGPAIEQLVLNLLLNAADSLEPGGRATLTAEVSADIASVSVRDEGGGIAPENLHRVFDAFYSTKHEGTGLGLAVAQRIARAHGSELRVESELGSGATFSLTLPVESRVRSTPTVSDPQVDP